MQPLSRLSRRGAALAAVAALTLAACGKPSPLIAVVPPTAAQVAAVSLAQSYEAGDSDISTRVSTALRSDAETGVLDIRVMTVRGDVKLSGTVDSGAQVDRVLRVARAVPGVVSLEDQMSVRN